jgi:hypothetical protein
MAEPAPNSRPNAKPPAKAGSPDGTLERRRVLLSFVSAVAGVVVSAAGTLLTSLQVVRETSRDPLALAIIVSAIAVLALFTFVAERERAGPRPLARVTQQVTDAFLAGLEASYLNPRWRRVGRHE